MRTFCRKVLLKMLHTMMDKFHTEIPVMTSEADLAILTNILIISNGASYTNDIDASLDRDTTVLDYHNYLLQEGVVENIRTLMDQFHRDTCSGIGGGPGDIDKMCVNSKS